MNTEIINMKFINMKPAICFSFLASASALSAHPHVFIDGGVDFNLDGNGGSGRKFIVISVRF